MLKFIKGHVDSIDNVAIFPIISLVIFFSFFIGLFWWVYKSKKEYITKVSQIPFDHKNDNL